MTRKSPFASIVIQISFIVLLFIVVQVFTPQTAAQSWAAFSFPAGADESRIFLPILDKPQVRTYPLALTSGVANDTQPAFSPDMKTVVFISDRDGQSDIFSLSLLDGTITNLTQSLARQEDTPSFSPDGTKILYASNNTSGGDWDVFSINPDGSGRQTLIAHPGTDEQTPRFSADGSEIYFSSTINGDWQIFRATAGADSGDWIWLTFAGINRFPMPAPDGETVVFRRTVDGDSDIYLMDKQGQNIRPFAANPTNESNGKFTPDMSGIVFDSDRSGTTHSHLANAGEGGLLELETRPDWQMRQAFISDDGLWLVYAGAPVGGDNDLYLDRFTTPLMAISQLAADNIGTKCGWEPGFLSLSWYRLWQQTGQPQYLRWIKEYVDRCMPGRVISGVNDSLMGYAALVLYEEYGSASYLSFAEEVADWLMVTAVRTPNGTLTHTNDGKGVWADTLLGVTPFLLKMGEVIGDPAYADEAISQFLKHANYLQNSPTGLFHHAWSTDAGFIGEAYWNRGNGWALIGATEILSAIDNTHPSWPTVLNIYTEQIDGLVALQTANGAWRIVVDQPTFYEETSGSTLITYGLQQGLQAGWLDEATYGASFDLARDYMWSQVDADGKVTNVSVSTGPKPIPDYNNLLHEAMQLYGQAAVILVATP